MEAVEFDKEVRTVILRSLVPGIFCAGEIHVVLKSHVLDELKCVCVCICTVCETKLNKEFN